MKSDLFHLMFMNYAQVLQCYAELVAEESARKVGLCLAAPIRASELILERKQTKPKKGMRSWTVKEVNYLIDLIRKHGTNNWDIIYEEGRSVFSKCAKEPSDLEGKFLAIMHKPGVQDKLLFDVT